MRDRSVLRQDTLILGDAIRSAQAAAQRPFSGPLSADYPAISVSLRELAPPRRQAHQPAHGARSRRLGREPANLPPKATHIATGGAGGVNGNRVAQRWRRLTGLRRGRNQPHPGRPGPAAAPASSMPSCRSDSRGSPSTASCTRRAAPPPLAAKVLPPAIDRLGADAVLFRHVRDRLGVGLQEDRDHLLVGESGLLHDSLAAPRAPFSQASVGPKNGRQVRSGVLFFERF